MKTGHEKSEVPGTTLTQSLQPQPAWHSASLSQCDCMSVAQSSGSAVAGGAVAMTV